MVWAKVEGGVILSTSWINDGDHTVKIADNDPKLKEFQRKLEEQQFVVTYREAYKRLTQDEHKAIVKLAAKDNALSYAYKLADLSPDAPATGRDANIFFEMLVTAGVISAERKTEITDA